MTKDNSILDPKFPYRNFNWLYEQRFTQKRSTRSIADKCGVDTSTIVRYLEKFKIQCKVPRNKIQKRDRVLTDEQKDIRKAKIKENQKRYRIKNPEKIKEKSEKYYKKNRDKILDKKKEWTKIKGNKQKRQERSKNNYIKNRDKFIEYTKEYQKRPEVKNRNKIKRDEIRIKALNILGDARCEICGDKNVLHLTIDHVDEKGNLDRKNGFTGLKLHSSIVNGAYPKDRISNLRVLCYNHNCGRMREYYDFSEEKLTYYQHRQINLYKDAVKFFGPCGCGISDLKFLTISHIHNDGAERRKNGEKTASNLLARFRKQKYPQSLKEDFCFECWNCNCS